MDMDMDWTGLNELLRLNYTIQRILYQNVYCYIVHTV